MKQSLDIAADSRFKALLAQNKHADRTTAPPAWRALFDMLQPFRFDHSAGISYVDNKLKFIWYCSEVACKGNPDEVVSAVSALLTKSSFTAFPKELNEHGFYEHHFTKQEGEFTHLIILEGMERFVGTPDPRCGGTLQYEITCNGENAQPTVRAVLSAFPELNCPELPAVLLDYFNDLTFTTLIYGGTWTHYYNWGVQIYHSDPTQARDHYRKVEKILGDMGFSLIKSSRGVSTYEKQGAREPIFYLAIYDNTIFSFRIQPHT